MDDVFGADIAAGSMDYGAVDGESVYGRNAEYALCIINDVGL